MLSLNPELAPLDMVFEQAMTIERLPTEEREKYEARLQETKVVLIRSLISDQLRYITIAKQFFTISDLMQIRSHKIGPGRIGGKAAGMLRPTRILSQVSTLPTDHFSGDAGIHTYVGADVSILFMSINNSLPLERPKIQDEEKENAR